MQTNYAASNGETLSEQASEQSMTESVTCLEQRVFVKEHQQNNKLLEKLKDFLKFERQTVQTQINELRNPTPFRKPAPAASEAAPCTDNDLVQANEQLKKRVAELENELTALHGLYKKRLQEESSKSNEKNEFFLHLIDQLHNKHTEEVEYYRGVIADFEEERKHITNIELKMSQIGIGIEDIVKESSELTRRNEQLEGRLSHQQQQLTEVRAELDRYRQLANTYQAKADEYEKLRLRGLKYQRDLGELIDEAEQRLKEAPIRDSHSSLCKITGVVAINCPHCRLNNIEGKYTKMFSPQN